MKRAPVCLCDIVNALAIRTEDDAVITPSGRRWAVRLAGSAAVVLLAACMETAPHEPAGDAPTPHVSSSLPPVFYVDPDSPSATQAAQWEAEGRLDDAALLRRISEQPTAKWLTSDQALVREAVDSVVSRATVAGQTPVLVARDIPQGDCGSDRVGGAADATAYRTWVRQFATGIDDRPAIVILEPKAIGDALSGCVDRVSERYALLRDAVAVLKSKQSVRVYLDAGEPSWIKNIPKLAAALKRAGIAEADGFALNVASFARTADNVRYGHRVSDALGGKTSFVIDTSRNGTGPHPGDQVGGAPTWCNPPRRALGERPTDDTGIPRVDALLWIKYPGESDGPCRPGEPEVGDWWPEYALDLARRSTAS